MGRTVQFVRSVLPTDPWQLLYLTGAVFLFLSPRLSWLFGDTGRVAHITAGQFALSKFPVVCAGVLAYYGCFRTEPRPLRRIALTVFLPALTGFCLLIGVLTFLSEASQSIFADRFWPTAFVNECAVAFRERPAGIALAAIALAMLGVFATRMYFGLSSLPLSLGDRIQAEDDPAEPWKNTQFLIFALICPQFLLYRLPWMLFSIPRWWWYRSEISGVTVYGVLGDVVEAVLLVLVAVLILGRAARTTARSSLKVVEPRFALLALLLPVLISIAISLVAYGYDRAQLAAHDFSSLSPPEFSNYFRISGAWHWQLFLMLFAALAEEVVFRGMLLRLLMRRFGLHRGILLTGLIWAAFHFHGDMRLRYSIGQALLQLASRIAICVAMSYVLSWMTLRWGSVIPSAIAHTVSNVLIVGGVNAGIQFAHETRIVLWAICALVLFRYCPIERAEGEAPHEPVVGPEPADA